MWRSVLESRSSAALLLLLPVACLLVACGREKQNAPSGQKVAAATSSPKGPVRDFCTLLTREEVEAAAGWKVTSVKNNGGAEYGDCTYTGRTEATVFPPEKIEAGVLSCVTNMPCTQDLPDFHSSEEMAQWRRKGYQEYKGPFEGMQANIVALDGYGVPAIDHELATMRSIEMQLGHKRVAYVSTWGESGPARDLAKKVLARAR